MVNIKNVVLVISTLLMWPQAYAINKCTGADGRVVFQDAVCNGKSETLNIRSSGKDAINGVAASAPSPQAGTGQAKPMSEAQRIEALVLASQNDRRKTDLEVRIVPNAFAAINQQRAQCDVELKSLQERKLGAKNNLAGATWEASISSEMTAIATRCGTRNTEVREDYSTLLKECQMLGGCKQ